MLGLTIFSHTEAEKETGGEASTSRDAMYASWLLYDTNEPSHVSSGSETEEQIIEQPAATVQHEQESVCQILQQLLLSTKTIFVNSTLLVITYGKAL